MTTTTRTMTRKTPWAAALTALLAVLALVFGVMAFAGVANAKDNGNDNKPDNPGNSANANGHQDDATHGNSDGTPGGGNENNNPNNNGPGKVWVCHADTNNGNGNTNLGVEGPDGQGTGGEFGTGYNVIPVSMSAWLNGHKDRHPNDKMFFTEAEALDECGPVTPTFKCPNDPSKVLAKEYTEADRDYCYPPTLTKDAWLCDLNAVPPAMTKFADPSTAYSAALANTAQFAATCPITTDQATAIDAAMAAVTPEPATVAPVQPAKVAVPAAAKPMPATVPAGDGSSVPQAPVALLALLALATATAVTSGLRVAKNR